jgi:hypothetical protein
MAQEQAPDDGSEPAAKRKPKKRETEVMRVQRQQEEHVNEVDAIQAKDDATHADLSSRFERLRKRFRLGFLRIKKANGGLTVAEAAEECELEEA